MIDRAPLLRVLATCVLLGCGVLLTEAGAEPIGKTVSLAMPSFAGEVVAPADRAGSKVSFDELAGARATVVVTGPTTWCKPCRSAYQYLATRHAALATTGVGVVGLASGMVDAAKEAKQIAATGATFPVLGGATIDDLQERLGDLIGNQDVPALLIVESGTITWVQLGWRKDDGPALEAALAARGLLDAVASPKAPAMRGEVVYPARSKIKTIDVGGWVGSEVPEDARRRAVIVLGATSSKHDKVLKWLVKKHKALTKAKVEIVGFDPARIKAYKKLGVKFLVAGGERASAALADLETAVGTGPLAFAVIAGDGTVSWAASGEPADLLTELQAALSALGALPH